MTSPCVFIEAFIDERLSAGLTLQEAASSLHHALVAASQRHGLQEPSWSSVMPFPLLSLEQCALAAKGARASGNGFAACASSQPLPGGNHGENVLQGASL